MNITAVDVLDNPTLFTNPMQFEIQYECLHELQHGARLLMANNVNAGCTAWLQMPQRLCLGTKSCNSDWLGSPAAACVLRLCAWWCFPCADLEWKLIYVGSAESEKYDQVLDSVLVGPVYPGSYRFVFQVSCTGERLLAVPAACACRLSPVCTAGRQKLRVTWGPDTYVCCP